ncbi:MAG: hypothetical protein O4861_21405 [Trichodesmium sp. St16_bin4-tuft]|nr:hypothetical protein [Trichodesmium sp. St16_bin4-tuft]
MSYNNYKCAGNMLRYANVAIAIDQAKKQNQGSDLVFISFTHNYITKRIQLEHNLYQAVEM